MTIRGNTITIGRAEKCDTVIKIDGNVQDNDFRVGEIKDCGEGVVVGQGSSIQSQLGLPEDTDVLAIKEALIFLRDNPGGTVEDKRKALKPLAIWKYIERTADISTVIASMSALLGSPQAVAFLASI